MQLIGAYVRMYVRTLVLIVRMLQCTQWDVAIVKVRTYVHTGVHALMIAHLHTYVCMYVCTYVLG